MESVNKTFRTHKLGFDLKIDLPASYVAIPDGSMPIIQVVEDIGTEPDQVPVLTILRQPNQDLETFTDISIKQLKSFGIKGEPKVSSLSGRDAREMEYEMPETPLKCLQNWTVVDNSAIVFTFMRMKEQFNRRFVQLCEDILRSVEIGSVRAEHTVSKNFYFPGIKEDESIYFRFPYTFSKDVKPKITQNGTSILGGAYYIDNDKNYKGVICYDNSFTQSAQEYERLLIHQMSKMASVSSMKCNSCNFGDLVGRRLRCQSTKVSQNVKNRIALYFTNYKSSNNLEKSTGDGIISVRFEYEVPDDMDQRTLDIFDRIVASFKVLAGKYINVNDKAEPYTYENLTWGFGFEYDNTKYDVAKLGSTLRLKNKSFRTQQKDTMYLGDLIPMIKPIIMKVDDMSLDLFVNDATNMIKEDDATAQVSTKKRLHIGENAAYYIVVTSQQNPNQRVITWIFRVNHNRKINIEYDGNEENWFILRWATLENDFNQNFKTMEKIVKSFHFF